MALLRRVAVVVAGVLTVGRPADRPAASVQQPTFRSRTDVVSVNVSVRQGRQPVTNLTAGDFAIADNGIAQTVDVLALAHVPIDLTLVMAWQRPPNRNAREMYFRAMTSA